MRLFLSHAGLKGREVAPEPTRRPGQTVYREPGCLLIEPGDIACKHTIPSNITGTVPKHWALVAWGREDFQTFVSPMRPQRKQRQHPGQLIMTVMNITVIVNTAFRRRGNHTRIVPSPKSPSQQDFLSLSSDPSPGPCDLGTSLNNEVPGDDEVEWTV